MTTATQLAPRQRPHVFGMTASPVNVRATHSLHKVAATIAELEQTLDAKVRSHHDLHNDSPSEVVEPLRHSRCNAQLYRLQAGRCVRSITC